MAKRRRIKKKKIIQLGIILILIIVGIVVLIQLLAKKDFIIKLDENRANIGSVYEPHFKATFRGKDVTNEVVVKDKLDTSKEGKFSIQFVYQLEGKEYQQKKEIHVTDIESPKISLTRGEQITVLKDAKFEDPGYQATDNVDGDISQTVKVSGTVDTSKEGDYTVTYTATDKKKNTATVTRKVKVSSTSPLTMSVKDFSLDGYFSDVTLPKTDDAGAKYIEETIFAGDSMPLYYVINKQILGTQLWHRQSIDPETALTNTIYINHQESGLTFVQALEKYKPKRLILALGTNSVSFMEPNYFITQYTELLKQMKQASPETKLIVQSIPPVDKRLDSGNGITNKKINILNYYIAEVCSNLNVKFLDSARAMKDSNGTCKTGYCLAEDGIHPTKEGNIKIMEYIKTHAWVD